MAKQLPLLLLKLRLLEKLSHYRLFDDRGVIRDLSLAVFFEAFGEDDGIGTWMALLTTSVSSFASSFASQVNAGRN